MLSNMASFLFFIERAVKVKYPRRKCVPYHSTYVAPYQEINNTVQMYYTDLFYVFD